VKLEIEALSNRGISFITEEYLPRKLRERDWLE
jgi:DNA topoisomerase VI subunit A